MWIICAYLAVSFLAEGVYRLREVGDLVGDAAMYEAACEVQP